MIIGVPAESLPGERRVAVAPASVPSLSKVGAEVLVEEGAGRAAGFPDAAYQAQGARLVDSREALYREAEIILRVRPPYRMKKNGDIEVEPLRKGQVVIGLLDALGEPQLIRQLADEGVIALTLDLLPRITRAQSMDVLSSQATISGYRAVLHAALALPRLFPMLMTAAGTIKPAKVFIIGSGVAGLQAIATARRLGATVQAYDVRPTVKEQVESVGARFVELALEAGNSETASGYARAMDEGFYKRQHELMGNVVADSDVVISTALVPGQPAPILVTAEMVERMHPGSVIVDLAAERGGNCELTMPDQTIEHNGVTITGPTNLPAEAAHDASQMYSRNITAFLLHLIKDSTLTLDADDEIVRATLLTRDGSVVNEQVERLLRVPRNAATSGKEA